MIRASTITVVFFFFASSSIASGAELQAGAATADISPPPGVSLDGPISKNGVVTSIHDPLNARALVLTDSKSYLAIIVCDVCVLGEDVADEAKRLIGQMVGIPPARIVISATHTHSAPRLTHVGRDSLDDDYHRFVSRQIAEAVAIAYRRLRPAELAYASFDRPDLLACRRFLCAAGSVGVNPFGIAGERIKSVSGKSTSIIEPAGPIDPQFTVLSIRGVDGNALALLGNFSVHYCGGTSKGIVSADYFGSFCHGVEALLTQAAGDPPVVGLMTNGTSGNTGSFQSQGNKFAPFEGIDYYGRLLAGEAVKAIDGAIYQRDVPLKMLESEIDVAVRKPDQQRLKWANQSLMAGSLLKPPHPWSRIYAQEAQHLDRLPEKKRLKLQAILLGDVAIATCPCEVFAETGLEIKAQSPIAKTFTVELANGYGGYLPPRKQHELGGYESWPARSSFLAVDAEETIRATLIRMLHEVSAK